MSPETLAGRQQAEEAAQFYVSIFKNARIVTVARYGDGGPEYHFTSAISLFVHCETQAEVDALWGRFLEGGAEVQCGWITDRFGVSWQIVPTVLGELFGDADPERSQRVMWAMLG